MSLCMCVCVCFIDLFIAPKEISAAFHLLLQFPHRGRQDTDKGTHRHIVTVVLLQRMQGPYSNVA